MKLTINRRKKFNPTDYFGEDRKEFEIGWSWREWSIWKGGEECSGKVGYEHQDSGSLKIKVLETSDITGANLIIPAYARKSLGTRVYPHDVKVALSGRILADAQIGLALINEKGQLTLNRLYEELKCGLIHLLGTEIRLQYKFKRKPGTQNMQHFMLDENGGMLPHWIDYHRTNRTKIALYMRRYPTKKEGKFRWGFGAWPMIAEKTSIKHFFVLSFPS